MGDRDSPNGQDRECGKSPYLWYPILPGRYAHAGTDYGKQEQDPSR